MIDKIKLKEGFSFKDFNATHSWSLVIDKFEIFCETNDWRFLIKEVGEKHGDWLTPQRTFNLIKKNPEYKDYKLISTFDENLLETFWLVRYNQVSSYGIVDVNSKELLAVCLDQFKAHEQRGMFPNRVTRIVKMSGEW